MKYRYIDSVSSQVREIELHEGAEGLDHESGRVYEIDDRVLYLKGSYRHPVASRFRVEWQMRAPMQEFGLIRVGFAVVEQ